MNDGSRRARPTIVPMLSSVPTETGARTGPPMKGSTTRTPRIATAKTRNTELQGMTVSRASATGGPNRAPVSVGTAESMGTIVGRALRDPSFILIFLGFFSCGYQLGFITAHFPAFVTEVCSPIPATGVLASLGITTTSTLGAVAIAVIGMANIAGTLTAGALGAHYQKKYLLAQIYLARTVVAAAFISAPMTPGSVLLFSLLMGALWLATVPLTSGLVAQIWGLRYMGTLYGVVFFSHQLGGFLGIWLGGRLYDLYGNYTLVWWIGVGVGAFSALVHLPIRERSAALEA